MVLVQTPPPDLFSCPCFISLITQKLVPAKFFMSQLFVNSLIVWVILIGVTKFCGGSFWQGGVLVMSLLEFILFGGLFVKSTVVI